MHCTGLAFAALALAIVASPLEAQEQPIPASLQSEPAVPPAPPPDRNSAVPPAPPPDVQVSPGGPPPFVPMPARPPQHRWVNVGGHHRASRADHRARTAHHRKAKANHRLTRAEKNSRYCHSLSHRRMTHNRICVALMRHERAKKAKLSHHRLTRAEKNSRYCHSLSHRRMMHNRTCVALVRHERAAKNRHVTHHRARHHVRRHRR